MLPYNCSVLINGLAAEFLLKLETMAHFITQN